MIKIEIMVIENNTEKITDKMIGNKIIIENQDIKIHKTYKMLKSNNKEFIMKDLNRDNIEVESQDIMKIEIEIIVIEIITKIKMKIIMK
jgi:hypothetical protein